MTVSPEVFDDDYLYFDEVSRPPVRSDAEAALIVKLLGSCASGKRVLDVACGYGRLSSRLADAGCSVVGIDISERALALARSASPTIDYRLVDMRAIAWQHEFDVAISWYTTIGYCSPAEKDSVFRRIARALRPGGCFLLDLYNPALQARLIRLGGGSATSMVERDGNGLVDIVRAEPRQSESETDSYISVTDRFIFRDGRHRRLSFRLEEFPAPALVDRLRATGFGEVRVFGEEGTELSEMSPRLIVLARA